MAALRLMSGGITQHTLCQAHHGCFTQICQVCCHLA